MNPPPYLPPPPPGGTRPSGRRKKRNQTHPQAKVSRFWSRYHCKAPGKVTSIFPRKLYKDVLAAPDSPQNNVRNAGQNYEAARSECIAKVRRAAAQCERTNSIFTDHDFDLETDFDMREYNCIIGLPKLEEYDDSSDEDACRRASPKGRKVKDSLRTLIRSGVIGSSSMYMNLQRVEKYVGDSDSGNEGYSNPLPLPQSIHRASWIFESPQFVIDGFSSSDIRQGALGDCWWVAAVGNIAHRKDLMEKVCVARDEECGIYGFVFHRDGEWISTIVDDNLCLTYEDHGLGADVYDAHGKKARLYKKQKQTGSEALFYSKCEDENETWLPLMEKAFAKVHGDYQSIHGGWLGCGVEDMTGGVTSFLLANRVLRKDRLWREMLSVDQDNGGFVFGVSASSDAMSGHKNGLILNHAYSVLKAVEVENEDGKKIRLIKMRNPWGQKADTGYGEWHGPWSDGSKEWTPFMLQRLRYEFSDDGIFWMSFEDVLNSFKWIHRTRLFDEKWTVAQQWTSDPVSWVSGYLKSKFIIEVKSEGLAIIVLAKLDSRYFQGLEGQYRFYLAFALRKVGTTEILAEARGFEHSDRRSVNCELYLEPGTYEVLPKITAKRKYSGKSIEQVLRSHADKNPHKLQQVGRQYDLAHGRAGVLDEDAEQERKKLEEKKKRKQKKGNQPKVDKMQEMKDAMAKMQLAMTNMQNELSKKNSSFDNDGNQKESQKSEERSSKKTDGEEVSKGQEGAMNTPSTKLTPGLWPGCSFDGKAKDQLPQRSQEAAVQSEKQTHPQDGTSEPSDGKTKDTPEPSPDAGPQSPKPSTEVPVGPPSIPNGQPTPDDSSDSDSDSDSDSSSDSSSSEPDSGTAESNPRWNPVCVTCLRVYTQDKEVSIKLVKNESAESSEKKKPAEKPAQKGPEDNKDNSGHKATET